MFDQDKDSIRESSTCLRRASFTEELHEALLLHEVARDFYGVKRNEDGSYSIVDLEKIKAFPDNIKDPLRAFLKMQPGPLVKPLAKVAEICPPPPAPLVVASQTEVKEAYKKSTLPRMAIPLEVRKSLDFLYEKIDTLPKRVKA